MPQFPQAGEDVELTCKFRLGGKRHKLYTVNWWRAKDQFYTYKKNSIKPKNAYSFPGINVKVSETNSVCCIRVLKTFLYTKIEESTEERVVLSNVNEATSGTFKCEVMGEGPAFRTAVKSVDMHVIGKEMFSPENL